MRHLVLLFLAGSQLTAGHAAPKKKVFLQAEPTALEASLDRALQKHVGATVADLAARAPAFQPPPRVAGAKYLERILEPQIKGEVFEDPGLNTEERAALARFGFVVSRRLGDSSFAEVMLNVYRYDQPLFVSADAVLHAWHMTYDAMLEELEVSWFVNALEELLEGMASKVNRGRQLDYELFSETLTDVDFYLAVARSLLAGRVVYGAKVDGNNLEPILDAIDRGSVESITLFGSTRPADFSQMKPRGHYTHSDELKRYFKAMKWLGRTQLVIAGEGATLRELSAALVLHELLEESDGLARWREMDELLETFVGRSDSMGPAQLNELLARAGVGNATRIHSAADLLHLQERILLSGLGAQEVDSRPRTVGARRNALPRTFSLLGERFTLDSWATGQLVFGQVLSHGKQVDRQVPSGVDVAFTVLGNDNTAPLLAARMESTTGMGGRDGFAIQQSLLAVRKVVDARPPFAWEGNLYDQWLGTLRALSAPTTDARFPSVMRTEAWSRRVLGAQLASWAELRHDTILYAKESYGSIACEYPAGFVEMVPEFWKRLEMNGLLAADALDRTRFPRELRDVKKAQVAMAKKFSSIVATLREISELELRAAPLGARHEKFLKEAVKLEPGDTGCVREYGHPPEYTGWYFQLFYEGEEGALDDDALVADVHTTGTGGVLHAATGPAALMVVLVDRGADTMAFAGPVSTYYEFLSEDGERLTDEEWRQRLRSAERPEPPEWTQGWLVGNPHGYGW